jgi:hypothetical protein
MQGVSKRLYNGIPNVTVWRVLRKHLYLKAYILSIVCTMDFNGRPKNACCMIGQSFEFQFASASDRIVLKVAADLHIDQSLKYRSFHTYEHTHIHAFYTRLHIHTYISHTDTYVGLYGNSQFEQMNKIIVNRVTGQETYII